MSSIVFESRVPSRCSRFYAKGALQYLVPVLQQKLTKQEENDDEDDWNPSKAAGVCLMLLASCCEDDIVPHVLPFVKDNIKSPNWRCRDAALMAFGTLHLILSHQFFSHNSLMLSTISSLTKHYNQRLIASPSKKMFESCFTITTFQISEGKFTCKYFMRNI
jgi:hypothetical protein